MKRLALLLLLSFVLALALSPAYATIYVDGQPLQSKMLSPVECPSGQHLGPRDKDDGHRECVPDKPKHKLTKKQEAWAQATGGHAHKQPETKGCSDCVLNCDLSLVNEKLDVLIARKSDPPATPLKCKKRGEFSQFELNEICDFGHEPYSSPPPPGHWVSGAGLWWLPSARSTVSYNVVEVEHRPVDPRHTLTRDAILMPYLSHGYEFANGLRLMGHVGYELGGDTSLSSTPLHYGPGRRVTGLRESSSGSPWTFGAGVEWRWK